MEANIYLIKRRFANYPPHQMVPNVSNPWVLIDTYATMESAYRALDAILPSDRFEYAVFQGNDRHYAD